MWNTIADILLVVFLEHHAVVNGLNLERKKHHLAESALAV